MKWGETPLEGGGGGGGGKGGGVLCENLVRFSLNDGLRKLWNT